MLQTLHTFGLKILVIVVTINKAISKELLGLNTADADNLMPYSGTIVKVGGTAYLLFSNTRYESTSKPAQNEYHFPVKIALSCTVNGMLDDMNLVEQLIDQVYPFSRMYWKSTTNRAYRLLLNTPKCWRRFILISSMTSCRTLVKRICGSFKKNLSVKLL